MTAFFSDHGKESHTTLAFYGMAEPILASCAKDVFHRLVNNLSEFLGREPDRIGLSGCERYKSYKRMKRGLEASDFSTLTSYTILFKTEGLDDERLGHDCLVMVSFRTKFDNHAVIDLPTKLWDLDFPLITTIARTICSFFKPKYGIGYNMESEQASWYAIGMGHGIDDMFDDPIPDKEYWQQACLDKVYLKHRLLREVYPLNYLTTLQLEAPVRDLTLRTWIERDSRNGSLSPMTEQVSVWKVDEGERDRISKELRQADRLLAYHHLHLDDPPAGEPLASEEEVLSTALQVMGCDDPNEIQILKKEKEGLRELTHDETHKLTGRGPKKRTRPFRKKRCQDPF